MACLLKANSSEEGSKTEKKVDIKRLVSKD